MARDHDRLTTALRAALAATPLALGACILDLSGLSESSGAGGSGGGTTGSAGGSSCSALSCDCEAPCPAEGCAPAVLASGADAASPLGIASAPGALYWVNEAGGAVMRLLDDGSPPEAIAAGAVEPRAIAAGGDLVVWSAKDGLWACPPDACDAGKKMLASPMAPHSIREVAYDGTHVFWTDRGTTQNAKDGKVLRCDPASCEPAEIAVLQWAPAGLTLLDDALLWTNEAGQFQDGQVMKGFKPSPGAEEIIAGQLQPTGIAADEQRVYWTEYNAMGRVRACAHTSGYCAAPAEVAPAAGAFSYPRDVAVTGGRVYFSTEGAVLSCPVPGCGAEEMPKIHASGRPSLRRMAVGASCVFFTDESSGGSVLKVAR